MHAETTKPAAAWLAALRTPLGGVGGVLLLLLVATAILAPMLLGNAATSENIDALQQAPSPEHPFGTDALGRDILSRTLVATRLSLSLSLLAAALGVASGVVIGVLPLLLPGWLGRLVTAATDIAIAFPGLLLALFFAVVFGIGMTGAVLAIAVAIAPFFGRLTYTLASSVAGLDYVAAARVSGVGRLRVLARHVLRNIGDPLLVNATIVAGDALLAFSALSFLGIGVQAPQYDWGRIFNEGLPFLYTNPMAALGPGIAILVAGLALNLLGEAAAQVVGVRAASPMRRRGRTQALTPEMKARAQDDQVVLAVRKLRVDLGHGLATLTPVRGISFDIRRGECVALVGESGSGKSMTAMAVSQLLEDPARISADRLDFAGTPLTGDGAREIRHALRRRLAIVFQDPMSSFNPSQRMGTQLAEASRHHDRLSRRAAWARAIDRLGAVRIGEAARRARQLPHEFSGGMRQRAMIAMGLMGDPDLIVADEPTTALDVTVQRQVLDLLDEVRRSRHCALLLISHDLELVLRRSDRVLVMYAGRLVEELPAADVRTHAQHPYTRALLASSPGFDTDRHQPLPVIPGRPPQLDELPPGCAFAARCPLATDRCRDADPPLIEVGPGRRLACWHPVDPQDSDFERRLLAPGARA